MVGRNANAINVFVTMTVFSKFSTAVPKVFFSEIVRFSFFLNSYHHNEEHLNCSSHVPWNKMRHAYAKKKLHRVSDALELDSVVVARRCTLNSCIWFIVRNHMNHCPDAQISSFSGLFCSWSWIILDFFFLKSTQHKEVSKYVSMKSFLFGIIVPELIYYCQKHIIIKLTLLATMISV